MPRSRKLNLFQTNLILNEWYGEKRATLEMLSKLDDPKPLGEVLDKIRKNFMSPKQVAFTKIRDSWADIAGADIAKISTPIFLREGTIFVEVKHPMWLRNFNGEVVSILREKINQKSDLRICEDLKFVPAGRTFQAKPS